MKTQKVIGSAMQSISYSAMVIFFICFMQELFSQPASFNSKLKETVAILNIDSKGVIPDPEALSYLVRLELEKTGTCTVMDKYDVNDMIKKAGIDISNCFGKNCVVDAGEMLGADKMITGSTERFGEKIVITLRLIDVKTRTVEKTDATEYLNLQPEIQKMIEISVKKLIGIEPDPNMVNLLIDYDVPVQSPKTTLRLNGPRMGVSLTLDDAGERMRAPKNKGGYEMFPVTSQIGWQQEYQYLSAGNFQALIEGIVLLGGLESGQFIPSFTFLNGFRESKHGWEFAFGPTFRFVRKADGFYDTDDKLGQGKGAWHLKKEWNSTNPSLIDSNNVLEPIPYEVSSQIDSRGEVQLSTGFLLAVGKTFKSGYLNIPVNIYISPRMNGTIVGASFGFNVSKKPRIE